MAFDKKAFGRRIAAARKVIDMTQEELAERSGVALSAISRYEALRRAALAVRYSAQASSNSMFVPSLRVGNPRRKSSHAGSFAPGIFRPRERPGSMGGGGRVTHDAERCQGGSDCCWGGGGAMDELLAALAESLADAGPLYVIAFGALVLFTVKIWPSITRWVDRREDREDKREQRMADYQRESAERDGKWLMVSEQSARAMEAMSEQMRVNNTLLMESKERSRDMGHKVDEIHAAVVPARGEGTE